jgi:hypothetical protein
MTTRPGEHSLRDFSPEQLLSLAEAIGRFPSFVRARGREYAVAARVGPLLFTEDGIGARVRGTRTYETWWNWDYENWEPSCTCPIGMECKHQYALACCILDPLRHAAELAGRLARLLPDRPVVHARLGPPDPNAESRALPTPRFDEDDFESAPPPAASPVRARGRDFRPAPWSALGHAGPHEEPRRRPGGLGTLRAAKDRWSRAIALERMLIEELGVSIPLFRAPFTDILSGSDFEVMCWHLARALPAWTGGRLPAAIEPFANRPDLAERHVGDMRETLARRLAEWSAERARAPERSLRFVLGLERPSGPTTLTVEPRLTSRKLKDEPRSPGQLQHLLREAQRRPGHLPPDQVVLLEAYIESAIDWAPTRPDTVETITTSTVRRLLEAGAGTAALAWDEELDPELAQRYGIAPGEPVRRGERAVAVTPACEREDGVLVMRLQVRWPDGRIAGLDHALLLNGTREGPRRHPSLVVEGGEIHVVAEQPPPEIAELFVAAEGLPLDRKRHAPLLGQMVERFPALRESLAPVTRVHPAGPIVAIDVRDDDWLQIRLFAAADEAEWKPLDPVARGVRVVEYAPEGGWAPFAPPARGRGAPASSRRRLVTKRRARMRAPTRVRAPTQRGPRRRRRPKTSGSSAWTTRGSRPRSNGWRAPARRTAARPVRAAPCRCTPTATSAGGCGSRRGAWRRSRGRGTSDRAACAGSARSQPSACSAR